MCGNETLLFTCGHEKRSPTLKTCPAYGTTQELHHFGDWTTKIASKCSDCKAEDVKKASSSR